MKRLTSFALLSVLFFSCQKDLDNREISAANPVPAAAITEAAEGSGSYYVKFKSGNEVARLNFNTKALLSDAGTAKSLVLHASATAEKENQESIRLYLTFLTGSPVAGTYKQGDAAFKYLVSGAFNPGDASVTYTAGLTPETELPLSITIESINNGVIKGSFKGVFYKHDLTTGIMSSDHDNYTEGEFNLPIQ